MPGKGWDEITYPFRSFNGWTVEVKEWINNLSHTLMDVNGCNYLSMLGLKLIHASSVVLSHLREDHWETLEWVSILFRWCSAIANIYFYWYHNRPIGTCNPAYLHSSLRQCIAIPIFTSTDIITIQLEHATQHTCTHHWANALQLQLPIFTSTDTITVQLEHITQHICTHYCASARCFLIVWRRVHIWLIKKYV